MTVIYLDFRPGDKVFLKDAGIEGRVMYANVSTDAISYGVQLWDERRSEIYSAWPWEIRLVEEFEHAPRAGRE